MLVGVGLWRERDWIMVVPDKSLSGSNYEKEELLRRDVKHWVFKVRSADNHYC